MLNSHEQKKTHTLITQTSVGQKSAESQPQRSARAVTSEPEVMLMASVKPLSFPQVEKPCVCERV